MQSARRLLAKEGYEEKRRRRRMGVIATAAGQAVSGRLDFARPRRPSSSAQVGHFDFDDSHTGSFPRGDSGECAATELAFVASSRELLELVRRQGEG